MDKNIETAMQYLNTKKELYYQDTHLIEQCEQLEKDIYYNLMIIKQEKPCQFSQKAYRKWQETIHALESTADSIHKKLLELYEEFCSMQNIKFQDTKKRPKKT